MAKKLVTDILWEVIEPLGVAGPGFEPGTP